MLSRMASRSGTAEAMSADDRDSGRQHQGRLRQDHHLDPSGGGVRQQRPAHGAGRRRSPAQQLSVGAPAARHGGADRSRSTGSSKLTDPPRGTERLVIDAAAAMKTKHVFELVRMADVIVVPVLASAFDQATTAAFLDQAQRAEVDPQEQEAGRAWCATGCGRAPMPRRASLASCTDRASGPGHAGRSHDLQRRRGRRPLDLRPARQARRDLAPGLGRRCWPTSAIESAEIARLPQKCCQPVRSGWTSAPAASSTRMPGAASHLRRSG